MIAERATDATAPPPTSTDGRNGDDRLSVARSLVAAIAARNYKEIFSAFSPDARFRYLIPPGLGEVAGAADVAAKYVEWFGDADNLEVERVFVESLADRVSVAYRFRRHEAEREEVIEQQVFLDVDGQRITAVDLLCSGFRPIEEEDPTTASGSHHYDAGTKGCADGLAQEFRRRISAIGLGDLLVVETSDPAAKEDLPPLARMMGHKLHSIEPASNGRLLITVERGR
jgi:TusA-related sulfurtransferase